jgi:hypothetical protein
MKLYEIQEGTFLKFKSLKILDEMNQLNLP